MNSKCEQSEQALISRFEITYMDYTARYYFVKVCLAQPTMLRFLPLRRTTEHESG